MIGQELAVVLGIEEWPAMYDKELARFCEEWPAIKAQPLVDFEAIEALANEGYIATECLKDAKICLEKIKEDDMLSFAFACMFHLLCVYRLPSENEWYPDIAPTALGEYRYTFTMLLLFKILQNGVAKARERGIPEEYIAQHKGESNGGPTGENGVYGAPGMFHWRVVCAMATMYTTGAFRFEPERVPEGYRMMRRKADGKLLMLFTAERYIDEFGQFCGPDLAVFTVKPAVGKTDGYLIAPDGRLLDRYVTLPADEWEVAFDAGDTALSYHIPPNDPYNFERAADSFERGVAFYHTYYPEMNVRSIQSYSWLYSPQLKDILRPDSGINRLNTALYLAPVPSGPDGFYSFVFKTDGAPFDVETAPTDTSLRRGFVDFVKNGGRVHNGFMFLPASDAKVFAEKGRELYAWDMFENKE